VSIYEELIGAFNVKTEDSGRDKAKKSASMSCKKKSVNHKTAINPK
jgi:hypothetical protein